MEIFNIYTSIFNTWGYMNFIRLGFEGFPYPVVNWKILVVSLCISFAVWAALFLLQGVGIYTMAKRRGLSKKGLAFVPFVNLMYLEKLTGDCTILGQRMRRVGLFAMIAQIVNCVLCGLYIASHVYLYYTQGAPVAVENTLTWLSLGGFAKTAYSCYNICYHVLSITQLVYELLLFVLLLGLFKKYQPKSAYLLAALLLFFPMLRYIFVFVIRKREAVDYNEFKRKQQEEYYRRQYGHPYQPSQNAQPNPYGETVTPTPPKEEPFAEFDDKKTADGQGSGGEDEWFS